MGMREEIDYYAVLGVGRDASTEEIKRAYRSMVRESHPDVNPDDPHAEERFKAVAVAYEILSDPERRRQYDMFGAGAFSPAGNAGDFGFGDVFEMFFGDSFGRQRRRSGGQTGGDVVVEAELSFEEAVFGTTLELPEIEMQVVCEECGGGGAEPGTHPQRCSRCQGSGEVRDVRRTFLGNVMTAYPCQSCGGSGEELASPCQGCSGEGRISGTREIVVDVPAGIENGSQLRISGRGHAARRGGYSGDLYVTLRVRPHPVLERDGNDLVYRLELTLAQAALGASVMVPTLEGDIELKIDAGTQHGTVLRLKNQGVVRLNGRGRGDLRIPVGVVVPTGLSPEEIEVLRNFAELRGEVVAAPGVRERVKGLFQ